MFGLAREGQDDYIKSVQYGGQEVLGVPVELANSAAPIELTLSGGAGRIDGSVQPEDSDVSVGGVQVVLASETPRVDDGVLLAKTDQDGHFSFKNVVPGKCYAFAVADLDLGLLQSRVFLAQFQEKGLEVEVSENGNLRIRIPIVPAEDVQRALRTLGL